MKLPKLKHGDFVCVEWLDAFGCSHVAWMEYDEVDVEEEYVVHSGGFFIEQTKKYLILAGDLASGAVGRVFYIPLGMIQEVIVAKCKGGKKKKGK
jgi:hypothetical protein